MRWFVVVDVEVKAVMPDIELPDMVSPSLLPVLNYIPASPSPLTSSRLGIALYSHEQTYLW